MEGLRRMAEKKAEGWMPILLAVSLTANATGAAFVVRGDVLGRLAADRAETRMNQRADKMEEDFKEGLALVRGQLTAFREETVKSLRRIEDKVSED